jgi:hypothetical protein
MPNSLMRRLRNTGAVDQDGNIVTIPRLPSVMGAHKPPGWSRWSAVEYLLGMSLDRMHDYLPWPADGLDPYRLAAQTQVVRVIAMVAAKVGGEAARERDKDRILGDHIREVEECRRADIARSVETEPAPTRGKSGRRERGGLKFAPRLRKLREFCRTASPHAVPLALHTLVSTAMRHASHITRNAAMEAKSAPRPAVPVMALFSFVALASALVLAFSFG